jgi:hypothetical protein
MPALKYEIRANGNLLDEYTSFVTNAGRQQVQDPFKAGTASISGRDLSQVTGLNIEDTLKIDIVEFYGTPILYTIFNGRISDIKADYGFDANMDSWTIQGDDAIALAGRTFKNTTFTAGASCFNGCFSASSGTAVSISNLYGTSSTSRISAQSLGIVNTLQTWNELVQTEQGRIVSLSPTTVGFVERNNLNLFGTLCNFTDGTVASAEPSVVYQNVVFRSRADSYFTQVIVEPAGLAAQTAGVNGPTYTMKSYDQTTAQAGDLAAYVLATLDVSQDAPASVSYIAENQPSASAQFAVRAAVETLDGSRSVLLTLRGTQYSCFIEGVTISADPSTTRFTLNLSSSEAVVGLVLDDTILGVLDTSKLGF